MTTLDTLSFGPHGIRDPLYLNFLAISPAARKFGLGSRMLSHLKTVADSQQADFALNSEHAHLVSRFSTCCKGVVARGLVNDGPWGGRRSRRLAGSSVEQKYAYMTLV